MTMRKPIRCSRRTDSLLLLSIGICLLLLTGASFLVGRFDENGVDRAGDGAEHAVLLRPRFSFPIPRGKNALQASDDARGSSPCRPSSIHLSPATNVNLTSHHNVSMTVSFTLPDLAECSTSMVTPIVIYGRDGTEESSSYTTAPNESFQFEYSSYLRTFQSSWIHHAVLHDLKGGGERYWYKIRIIEKKTKNSGSISPHDEVLADGTVYNFTTPPLPLEPVRIGLIADWGGSEEAVRTMETMLSRRTQRREMNYPPLSAVIVAGDISYANSYLPSWESWLQDMEPLFSSTPLLVAAGNHEIECNRHNFQVFQAYESYFRNPNRVAEAHVEPIPWQVEDCTHPAEFMTTYWYGNSFYSYRHGLLQIIVLNSYTNTTQGSVQYQWLKEELEMRVDRTITPWLLTVFHCPFHTTFRGHNDEWNPLLMMKDMEPLFVQHRVNLVLSGHNHAYVRSYPMVGEKKVVDPKSAGPIYLTIGTGGDSHSQGPLRPYDPWVAHRDRTEYGFGELVVVNATHAYFERILNQGGQANPEARDDVWIRNTHEY